MALTKCCVLPSSGQEIGNAEPRKRQVRGRVGRVVLVAVAVAAVVLACACEPRLRTDPPPHTSLGGVATGYTGTGPSVAIIGDSLTVQTWDALYRNLAADHAVEVGAWFGEGFDGGAISDSTGEYEVGNIVDAFTPDQPSVVVLALGTNTSWHNAGHVDDIALALEREAEAVAAFDGSCLVWVTLPSAPGAPLWDDDAAQQLNDAATWADRTADWAGAVTAEPTLLKTDRVHATTAGIAVRARVIADAVRAC